VTLTKRHVRILGDLSSAEIRIYLWHLVNSNARGVSRCSHEDIARHLDLHRVTVTKAERKLDDEGLITVRRPGGKRSSVVVVPLHQFGDPLHQFGAHSGPHSPSAVACANGARRAARSNAEAVQDIVLRDAGVIND